MSKAITKAVVREAVTQAAERASNPAEIAREVLADPVIKAATTPISRFSSETLQGITAAGLVQVLVAIGKVAGFEVAVDPWTTIISFLLTIAGLAYAWYGRETTTRPLA
jgi:hypothetical protein